MNVADVLPTDPLGIVVADTDGKSAKPGLVFESWPAAASATHGGLMPPCVRVSLVVALSETSRKVVSFVLTDKIAEEVGRELGKHATSSRHGKRTERSLEIPHWARSGLVVVPPAAETQPAPVVATADTEPQAPPFVWLVRPLPDVGWNEAAVFSDEGAAFAASSVFGAELAGPYVAAALIPSIAPASVVAPPISAGGEAWIELLQALSDLRSDVKGEKADRLRAAVESMGRALEAGAAGVGPG